MVEQVAWGFAKTKPMEPFRELLKKYKDFAWSQGALEVARAKIKRAGNAASGWGSGSLL